MRELIRDPDHSRERSLGWLALAWIEALVVHGPGDVQGRSLNPEDPDALPLDDEFAGHIVDCYALDEDGRRTYDAAFLSRPKGRDKSGQAARLVLFEALGPCRFAGWAQGGEIYEDPYGLGFKYEYSPGEPMGRHVTYPFIRCLATEENQTGNTYDNVHFNLTEEDAPLSRIPGLDAGLTRTFLPKPFGGEIRPSSASNSSKDGGKETFVVFDETHLYLLPELHRMYRTVRRNAAKRKAAQPWFIETTTMYQPGEGSVAESTYEKAELIREGKTRVKRLFFDHREASGDVDLTDETAIRAALAEAYGPFAAVMDIDKILNEIWDPENLPSDSRRYFFNQRTSAWDAWLAEYEWNSRKREDAEIRNGDTITLGFDGSRKRSRGVTDATALIGCRVSDGFLFEIKIWEQPEGPAGKEWKVPQAEVLAAVRDAFQRYNVVGFYADPAKWESSVADWEAQYGKRLKVKATRTNPIEWWMTGGRAMHIVRATEALHTAVIDGSMIHRGDYALTRHVLNSRRRSTPQGIQISKESPDSPRKIDAAVAGILAWAARLDAIAAGVGLQGSFVPRRVR